PERRRRREAAYGEALADDRARAEEADAADDLSGDPRRVDPRVGAARGDEVAEAVGGDEREERRADADDEMRAQPRSALAQLPLHPDRAAERGRDEQPQQHVRPAERGDRRRAEEAR